MGPVERVCLPASEAYAPAGAENRVRVLDSPGEHGIDKFGTGAGVAVERDAADAGRRDDAGDAHLGIAGQAVGGRVQDRGDVAACIGPLWPAGCAAGIATLPG